MPSFPRANNISSQFPLGGFEYPRNRFAGEKKKRANVARSIIAQLFHPLPPRRFFPARG
jgi:hypothetical protein